MLEIELLSTHVIFSKDLVNMLKFNANCQDSSRAYILFATNPFVKCD